MKMAYHRVLLKIRNPQKVDRTMFVVLNFPTVIHEFSKIKILQTLYETPKRGFYRIEKNLKIHNRATKKRIRRMLIYSAFKLPLICCTWSKICALFVSGLALRKLKLNENDLVYKRLINSSFCTSSLLRIFWYIMDKV